MSVVWKHENPVVFIGIRCVHFTHNIRRNQCLPMRRGVSIEPTAINDITEKTKTIMESATGEAMPALRIRVLSHTTF